MLTDQRALARAQICDTEGFVSAAERDEPAILRPAEGAHRVAVHERRLQRRCLAGVPETHRAIGGTARQIAALLDERERQHGASVSDEAPLPMACDVVSHERAELAADHELTAILRHAESRGGLTELPALHRVALPNRDLTALAAARENVAAVGNRYRRRLAGAALVVCGGAAERGEIDVQRAVGERRGQRRTVARKRHCCRLCGQRTGQPQLLRAQGIHTQLAACDTHEQICVERERGARATFRVGERAEEDRPERAVRGDDHAARIGTLLLSERTCSQQLCAHTVAFFQGLFGSLQQHFPQAVARALGAVARGELVVSRVLFSQQRAVSGHHHAPVGHDAGDQHHDAGQCRGDHWYPVAGHEAS